MTVKLKFVYADPKGKYFKRGNYKGKGKPIYNPEK